MDLVHIATRISSEHCSSPVLCSQCGNKIDESIQTGSICGDCNRLGPVQPAVILGARKTKSLPKKVSKRKSPVVTRPETEYSVNVELSLMADFEGTASKNKLLKKLQSELFASIKEAVATTARELSLRATGVLVKPIEVGVAVTDMSESDESEDYEYSE
jgi:hypothetical protein